MLKLYAAKGGGNLYRSFRNLWMLEELGVPYEHVAAAPRSKEAKEGNPKWGKIPGILECFSYCHWQDITRHSSTPHAQGSFPILE